MGLGFIDIRLPIMLGGGLFLGLGVYLMLAMRETGFKPAPREDRNPIRHMGKIFGDGVGAVRGKPLLITILAITVIAGAASEGFDRLSTPHFIAVGWPAIGGLSDVQWFGAIKIAGMGLAVLATRFAEKRLNTANHRHVTLSLAALTAITAACVVGFGLAPSFWLVLVMYLLARTARDVSGPLSNTWINQHIESRVRATVLSMNGQLDALGQISLGPVFGWLGVARSIRVALAASGIALTPALLLYGRALKDDPAGEVIGEGQENKRD
jgi:hypothetical protein